MGGVAATSPEAAGAGGAGGADGAAGAGGLLEGLIELGLRDGGSESGFKCSSSFIGKMSGIDITERAE